MAVMAPAPLRPIECVLSMWELLQEIFLHLDITTLLLSISRVSKAWNNVVSTSSALQQALHFQPDAKRQKQNKMPVLNQLLVDKFGFFFDFGSACGTLRRAESFHTLPWTAWPRKTVMIEQRRRKPIWKVAKPARSDAQTSRDAQEDRKRFTRRGASWRKMLVAQPALQDLGVVKWECKGWGVPEKVSTAVSHKTDGLRMGELYDLLQHHAGHHELHSLWFRVIWSPHLSGLPAQQSHTPLHQKHWEMLLAQTNVVVDFHPADDAIHRNHACDPDDVDLFDSLFRCDEYGHPDLKLQEVATKHPAGPRFGMDLVRSSSFIPPPLPEPILDVPSMTWVDGY